MHVMSVDKVVEVMIEDGVGNGKTGNPTMPPYE